jgi:hypothetical protein
VAKTLGLVSFPFGKLLCNTQSWKSLCGSAQSHPYGVGASAANFIQRATLFRYLKNHVNSLGATTKLKRHDPWLFPSSEIIRKRSNLLERFPNGLDKRVSEIGKGISPANVRHHSLLVFNMCLIENLQASIVCPYMAIVM